MGAIHRLNALQVKGAQPQEAKETWVSSLEGSRQYEDGELTAKLIDGEARRVELHIGTWKGVADFRCGQ
ncbi:hypothetical protein L3X38_026263 [Prunus dulcis]|uniref:Uncharacterized protein n=1 Tax=Prunus dulcis TaxID=3755 RepID=A0AAD4Z869_PRUDU|nr:hypothetical protein L3X38_026263 [Prunus dulcis]